MSTKFGQVLQCDGKHLPRLSPDLIQAIRRRNTLFHHNYRIPEQMLRNVLEFAIHHAERHSLTALGIGTTDEVFHCCGILPVLIDKLNSSVRPGAME